MSTHIPPFTTFIPLLTTRTIRASKPAQLTLRPCGCGGKVGTRAAVKLHPRLNLLDQTIRYTVRCARCSRTVTTVSGDGFIRWQVAVRRWNGQALERAEQPGYLTKPLQCGKIAA